MQCVFDNQIIGLNVMRSTDEEEEAASNVVSFLSSTIFT